jgi:hypothetical protein
LPDGQERMIVAGEAFMVDSQPPLHRFASPEPDSRVLHGNPVISVSFDDLGGSGVDPASVRISLNGQDMTSQASVTAGALFLRPEQALSPGRYEVLVEARDFAGNQSARTWLFEVGGQADLVQSFTHNALAQVGAGSEITFTLNGAPGGTAVVYIADRVPEVRLQESEPGRYVGTYQVRPGDDLSGLTPTARFRAPDGNVYTIFGTQHLGDALSPLAPTIVGPTAGEALGNELNVRGTAGRRSRVVVAVEYSTPTGGGVPLRGTVLERVVFADDEGRWETGPIRLTGLFHRPNTTYTVTARSVGAGMIESAPVEIRLGGG